jgi:hypothetical protein
LPLPVRSVLQLWLLSFCWATEYTPRSGRSLIAASFGASAGYMLWRIEWFDIWRHGTPPLSYLVGYVPYIGAFAAIRWLLAGAVLGRPTRRMTS